MIVEKRFKMIVEKRPEIQDEMVSKDLNKFVNLNTQ